MVGVLQGHDLISVHRARFGPYAIRSGSRRQRPGRAFTMAWNKDPYNDGVKLIDCGDVSLSLRRHSSQGIERVASLKIPISPFDNALAVDQMEVAYSTLLKRSIATPEKANPKLIATQKGHPRIVRLGRYLRVPAINRGLSVVPFNTV